MPEKMISVTCKRAECAFYHEDPDTKATILCSHTDKEHYLHSHPCPLFRLDYRRQAQADGTGSPTDFLKVFRRR